MDDRIGRLYCRCQTARSAPATPHLERLLHAGVLDAYSEAIAETLGDDPAVYILRTVSVRLDLPSHGVDETALTRLWGRRMAGAVLRQIASGEDVVRFEDTADYLAHFAAGLLAGGAWESGLYGAFTALRPLGTEGALRAALLAEAELLPAVLTNLYRMGALEDVLAALGAERSDEIWHQIAPQRPAARGGAAAEAAAALELARPFFAAAVELVEGLAMWAGPRPQLADIGPALRGWQPPDWRDPQALAQALGDLLHRLAGLGLLRPPPAPYEGRLERCLEAMDWLDRAWLREALVDLLVELARSAAGRPPQAISQARVTTRQRQLLADLGEALRRSGLRPGSMRPGEAQNALRLLAVLVSEFPAWAGDPLAPTLIQCLLEAWGWLSRAGDQADALASLGRGEAQAALAHLPERLRGEASGPFQAAARLAPAGAAVLAALSAAAQPAVQTAALYTSNAGLALLIRAAVDARLPTALATTGFPDPARPAADRLQVVLLSLFVFWSGEAAYASFAEAGGTFRPLWEAARTDPDRELDPALRLFAGQGERPAGDEPHTWGDLLRAWGALETAAGQAAARQFFDEWGAQLAILGVEEAPPPGGELAPAQPALAPVSIARLGGSLLRLWARWLPNFSNSSPAYLMSNFFDRPGTVSVAPAEVRVELERRPLDAALEMSGYLDPLEHVPWLAGKKLVFA